MGVLQKLNISEEAEEISKGTCTYHTCTLSLVNTGESRDPMVTVNSWTSYNPKFSKSAFDHREKNYYEFFFNKFFLLNLKHKRFLLNSY